MTDEMSQGLLPFGHALRSKRLKKKVGLRKFAELVGVSPTYLSQVEQCNVMPPTADRVKRIAELLGENPDEWIALAGRVPDDLSQIIQQQPTPIAEFLRVARDLSSDEIRQLTARARQLRNRQT